MLPYQKLRFACYFGNARNIKGKKSYVSAASVLENHRFWEPE